ncbi:T-complex protein 1 subunit alpha [Abeliophyllum distichum]|uniref:T-complex protein 1 subunit alpha n=1 Tax=Abeliophyllum distichum TaxID=126358 RepID=A0ABD1TFI4_9LAMI
MMNNDKVATRSGSKYRSKSGIEHPVPSTAKRNQYYNDNEVNKPQTKKYAVVVSEEIKHRLLIFPVARTVALKTMLVDDIGDVTITNNGVTILKMLEVQHPAAKVLVELAKLQNREVGDGTTSVVIIAAELLELAMREACKYVDEKLAVKLATEAAITILRIDDMIKLYKTKVRMKNVKPAANSILLRKLQTQLYV